MEMTMLEQARGYDAAVLGVHPVGAVFAAEVWDRIREAIAEEAKRTKVFAKLLPCVGPFPDALTIPSDTTGFDEANDRLTVNEGETTAFTESMVQLGLTAKQVQNEGELKTAVTLSIRAANLLSQAQDNLLAQGDAARQLEPLRSGRVSLQNGPPAAGLVRIDPPAEQIVAVQPTSVDPKRYGEHTFEAVATAYTRLYAAGFPPPYGVVLPPFPYADAWSGPPGTLIATADRIAPLATAGFLPSGALPVQQPDNPESPSTGLVLAPGGNTMDLAVGIYPTMIFEQNDNRGVFVFRVYERFALRIKDPAAIIQLAFA
jgi:uncharacterized linocin/CFP29 family protein